jgi:hypothetical protein
MKFFGLQALMVKHRSLKSKNSDRYRGNPPICLVPSADAALVKRMAGCKSPTRLHFAGIAQLVERHIYIVIVASSILAARSILYAAC